MARTVTANKPKQKASIAHNVSKAATRNAPASAVNKILDFLMFFNSGNLCKATQGFIDSHLSAEADFECTDQVTKRYDFYQLASYLAGHEDWNAAAFQDVLDAVIELETSCANNAETRKMKDKLHATKMDIVFQIGLSILRETIGLEFDDLPEDAADLPFPSQISVTAYENKLDELYIQRDGVFVVESGEKHAQYVLQLSALTVQITDHVAPAKGRKNAAKKQTQTLNKQAVFDLLSKHRVQAAVDKLIQFVQAMEATALPIPLDIEVRVHKEQETVASALKRMTHKPDWTDKEVETAGPYASPRKTRGRVGGKAAAVAAEAEAEGDDDGDFGGVEEAVHREAPAAAAPAKAGSSSSSASAPRSPTPKAAATATASSVAPGSAVRDLTAASKHLKRKYDQMDPLNDFLAPDAAAAKARISGEAKLSAIKAAAPVTGSASKASAVVASIKSPVMQVKDASVVAAKVKKTAVTAASRKGQKVEFSSDSEAELEDIDDTSDVESAEDDDNSEENGHAVRALLKMKRQQQKAALKTSSKFPDRLESPAGKKGATAGPSSKSSKARRTSAGGTVQQRTKWNFEQEEALREAVEKYGEGNWAEILYDAEYSAVFAGRTNVNLKDKWRNLNK